MPKIIREGSMKYCVDCKHFIHNLNESPCRECLNDDNPIGRNRSNFTFSQFEKKEIKYMRRKLIWN